MGKKLDLLLGRSSKPTKLKLVLDLALSRLAILKNRRHVRCSQARSDVIHLLQLGCHEKALHRVEYVIEDQNLLDAYGMIELYCSLLIERVNLLQQARECPFELEEAVWGLVFASARCGNFPELQEIRSFFCSQFGHKFAAQALQFPNTSNVHPFIVEKLSKAQPSLESKRMLLKQLASENRIALILEEPSPLPEPEEIVKNISFSDPSAVRNYKDVAEAAQAAAYVAAAARAAVELYRSESEMKLKEEKKRKFESDETMYSKFAEFRNSCSASSIDSATHNNLIKEGNEESLISKCKHIFSRLKSVLKERSGRGCSLLETE